MIYQIFNDDGSINNTVAASPDFMLEQYPVGNYKEVVTPQVSTSQQLSDLKAAKKAEINAAWAKANLASFTYAGKEFACDMSSRDSMSDTTAVVALTGALPDYWPGSWKAVDNTYLSIPDVATWKAFVIALASYNSANFSKAQALKASLSQASDSDQVLAINW